MVDSIRDCRVVLTDLLHCPSDLERFGLSLEHFKVVPVLNSSFSPDHDNRPDGLSNKDESVVAIGQFVCSCGEYIKGASALVKHSLEDDRHSNKRLLDGFACPICDRDFAAKKLIYDHIRSVHGVKQFACDKCSMKFVLRKNLTHHQETHKECDICHMWFRSYKTLVDHLNSHAELSSFPIPQTRAATPAPRNPSSGKYQQEKLSNVSSAGTVDADDCSASPPLSEVYICSCGESFNCPETLLIHASDDNAHPTDNRSNSVKGPICNKEFPKEMSHVYLNNHIQACHRVKRLACDVINTSPIRQFNSNMEGQTIPKLKFVCSLCHSQLQTKASLKWHMKKHVRDREQFNCEICHLKFLTASQLEVHNIICHSEMDDEGNVHASNQDKMDAAQELFECVCCDEKFNSLKALLMHLRLIPRKGHSTCKICKSVFSNKGNDRMRLLIGHALSHTVDCNGRLQPTFSCRICKKVTDNLRSLLYHGRVHTVEKIHECSVCHIKFITKTELYVHFKSHPYYKPFTCETCGVGFKFRNSLNCHQRLHKDLVFSCDCCGDTFKLRDHLKKHVLKMHMEPQLFTCSTCGVKFKSNHSLKLHQRNHMPKQQHVLKDKGQYPFTCNTCGAKLKTKRILTNHQRTHMPRIFECSLCKHSFVSATLLERHHRNRHLMSKEFTCKVCEKRFWTSVNLKYHLEVVHEGKQQKCAICAKTYKNMNSLESHMVNVHSSAHRRSECKECGKKVFSLSHHMRTHRKSVCDICKKSFGNPKGLSVHLRRTHTRMHKYVCKHCLLRFASRNLLKDHCSNHCEFKPQDSSQNDGLQCKCCNKVFSTMDSLKVHLETIVSGTQF